MKRLIDQLRSFKRPISSGGISKPPDVEECEMVFAVLASCPEGSRFTFDGYEDENLSFLLAECAADESGWYVVSEQGLLGMRQRVSSAHLRSCPHFYVEGPDGAPLFASCDHFEPITFVEFNVAEQLRRRIPGQSSTVDNVASRRAAAYLSHRGVEGIVDCQSAVCIEIAAHGYVWWAVFLDTESKTTMVCGSDLTTRERLEANAMAFTDALEWLGENTYSLSSRRGVGRDGTVTFFGATAYGPIRFHRGETLVANPVNAVIDQCADYGPIVVSDDVT